MRLFLSAALATLLLSGAAVAAGNDEPLDDLTVVTATPRSSDVKMIVQMAKPAPAQAQQAKVEAAPPAAEPAPVKTASK